MLGNIGTGEMMLILLAILLVFGSKRIPEIARGLGTGIREFKAAVHEIKTELRVEDQQIRRATNVRPARTEPPQQAVPAEDLPQQAVPAQDQPLYSAPSQEPPPYSAAAQEPPASELTV